MAKKNPKGRKPQTKVQELVTVTFADSADQAKDYETILESNDIPVIIKEQDEQEANGKVIAVMVPGDFLDEAHVVIESQDAYDDFYDLSLEDEDEGDFDSVLFDEVP
ncbi:hypothetical protein ES703_42570 [subsurface metagenome]